MDHPHQPRTTRSHRPRSSRRGPARDRPHRCGPARQANHIVNDASLYTDVEAWDAVATPPRGGNS